MRVDLHKVMFWTVLIALTHSFFLSPVSPAQDPASYRGDLTGRLENKEIDEASGIAASLSQAGLFWVMNDSGGKPMAYAVDKSGRDLGRLRIKDVQNRDWEDLAVFTENGRSFLLIADVGDNRQHRDSYTIYIVAEPMPGLLKPGKEADAAIHRRIDFIYPDGAHDCEAVAVDGLRRLIVLLTKRDEPPGLYILPLNPATTENPIPAQKVTSVTTFPPEAADDLIESFGHKKLSPTSMDIRADGLQAVVLTYRQIYLFARRPWETWAEAFGHKPVQIPLPRPDDIPGFYQREAVCYGTDGDSLYVTSEGKKAGIYCLKLNNSKHSP